MQRAWTAVALLIAAYAISFVDRQILALLVEPVRADLGISDTQIGLLQGPAFGLFYAIAGFPLGWLADRVHRVRLMMVGIAMWSLMTVACGLSTSFTQLFLARVGVGVGEAALVPAAVSLIADLFTPARRALPLSVFTMGASLGAGLALLLGGSFVAFAENGAGSLPLIGPWLATYQPWQIVFVLAGLAGLPIAAAVLTIPEPHRGAPEPARAAGPAEHVGHYLRRHWRLFVPLLAGSSLLYLLSNAFAAWLPTLFIRSFGWSPADAGWRLGGLILACALTGNLCSGMIATALARRGRAAAPLETMALGAALLMPVAILAPLAPTPIVAQIGFALIYFAIALCFGIATTTFVAVTPKALRAQMIALYLLIGNLVGLGLGPVSVGLLLDDVLADPNAVGVALSALAAATSIPGFALLVLTRRGFAARAVDVEATSAQIT